MRIIILCVFLSSLSFAQDSKTQASCESFILQYRLSKLKKSYTKSLVNNEPETYRDSIKIVLDSVQTKLDLLSREIYRNGHLKSEQHDSIKSICLASFSNKFDSLGVHKDSTLNFLFEELYMLKSGYLVTSKDKIIHMQSHFDNDNREYVQFKNSNIYVDSLSEWKKTELASWKRWMDTIDLHVLKIFGSPYSQLSVLEMAILDYYLRDFGARHSQNPSEE